VPEIQAAFVLYSRVFIYVCTYVCVCVCVLRKTTKGQKKILKKHSN